MRSEPSWKLPLTLIASLLLVASIGGCSKDEVVFEGEPRSITIPDVHRLVFRSISVSDNHVLSAGASGEGLTPRVILTDHAGAVLLDESLPDLSTPTSSAACAGAEGGLVFFSSPTDSGFQLTRVEVTPGAPIQSDVVASSADEFHAVTSGSGGACLVCGHFAEEGRVLCQQPGGEPFSWQTGDLLE
ncbi:MAG: hypothetical protein KC561_08230 [Myxococcales bacterium]|nr:hypothetical protein [Myxococcales bacterium]